MKYSWAIAVAATIARITTSITTPAAGAKQPFWQNEGDLCYLPEPLSFAESGCFNLDIQYCPELDAEPCKVSYSCWGHPIFRFSWAQLHYVAYIPQGVELAFSAIQKVAKSKYQAAQCNPCHIPDGNYKESCVDYRVKFLPTLHPEAPCVFQTKCDVRMVKRPLSQNNTQVNAQTTYRHNELRFTTGTHYKDMKNYRGYLVHPSDSLETTAMCYETGANATVLDEYDGYKLARGIHSSSASYAAAGNALLAVQGLAVAAIMSCRM